MRSETDELRVLVNAVLLTSTGTSLIRNITLVIDQADQRRLRVGDRHGHPAEG